MHASVQILGIVNCFHCGQPCNEIVSSHDRSFCCVGCKAVFEILNENNLCDYYSLDRNSGISQRDVQSAWFTFLDEPAIRKSLVSFDSADLTKITFVIPSIHCVSCIWLLESLRALNDGVLHTEVCFGKRSLSVEFNPSRVKLSEVADLLSSLGYRPAINLDANESKSVTNDRSLVYKIAVAGFCFGNVMLFSFPEYLGIDAHDEYLIHIFSYLNIALAMPVFMYSANGYFKSAAKSFKQKQINIDVPIAAGLIALFLRSTYDIVSGTGSGYLDSFTGLVFFLLIGRWFQSKTYESLAFDRDYKSYFPLAVHKLINNEWKPVGVYELKRADQIRVRNMEIVPADSILLNDFAYIDYSFVTGEARPVKVVQGDVVYAGGRLVGEPVELLVDKKTSQSHLTSLWNRNSFKKQTDDEFQKLIDRAARKFTWIVIGIALGTAVFWSYHDPSRMWLVLTCVLMVACPCALALATPFTYGGMVRAFGKHKFYVKNADIIERLASIDAVVFDKTGTVTHGNNPDVKFFGNLSPEQLGAVKKLTAASTHPLSAIISKSITDKGADMLINFIEVPGSGVQAVIEGRQYRVGSAQFVGHANPSPSESSVVFVCIDNEVKGYFSVSVKTRVDIRAMIKRLGEKCEALISGDNDNDRLKMVTLFGPTVKLLFNQDPHDKLTFISGLQQNGKKVLMVGDGLNDSGALKQSDVGIVVTDDSGIFVPACDGIIAGDKLFLLDKFIWLSKAASAILKIAFGISFFYNAIALAFAATGHLTPLVAAILMPLSSMSVVGFSTLAVNYIVHKKLK